MNYLKQAFVELLSGLTTKKNEKEIWTKNEYGDSLTVEPIDDENYILRRYWKNGQLEWEYKYKNNQLYGVCKNWDEDGWLESEVQYKNDKRHGIWKVYDEFGQIEWEEIWENGNLAEIIK